MPQLSITTTQNVNINFNTANVGERVVAYLLDVVVIAAYYFVVYFLIGQLLDVTRMVNNLDQWAIIAINGVVSLPVLLYTLLLESFFEGQTIGKRIMKIKVIKIDGYQAGFGDYLIRWLFRIVEVTGLMGLVGLIAMNVSKKTQRIGDMAAGTAVISLKNDVTINHTILRDIGSNYVPVYPLVIKLSDNDVRIIKETYETSYQTADFDMILKLQEKIENVTGIKSTSLNATAFVDTILKDYNYYTQNM
ncbi:transporter [Flavobacterium rivuli WB 3.3-2 = DSM 21788]|uniref:Transporter n=1 Tax=Flavobacterium rivuli WB 3.3-2 = DSM 21788 TaxID=1121895 RepID=A0A0A2MHQ1_9FLAO|nr:RDD family protein [Flavobacterium rivuli]KGO87840.1 transporter [Flavobacterium rivuli WB 3.3-2 = DSM 21788]